MSTGKMHFFTKILSFLEFQSYKYHYEKVIYTAFSIIWMRKHERLEFFYELS
jgi:hypothetical protein